MEDRLSKSQHLTDKSNSLLIDLNKENNQRRIK
jgi:hypothetical protein